MLVRVGRLARLEEQVDGAREMCRRKVGRGAGVRHSSVEIVGCEERGALFGSELLVCEVVVDVDVEEIRVLDWAATGEAVLVRYLHVLIVVACVREYVVPGFAALANREVLDILSWYAFLAES